MENLNEIITQNDSRELRKSFKLKIKHLYLYFYFYFLLSVIKKTLIINFYSYSVFLSVKNCLRNLKLFVTWIKKKLPEKFTSSCFCFTSLEILWILDDVVNHTVSSNIFLLCLHCYKFFVVYTTVHNFRRYK